MVKRNGVEDKLDEDRKYTPNLVPLQRSVEVKVMWGNFRVVSYPKILLLFLKLDSNRALLIEFHRHLQIF